MINPEQCDDDSPKIAQYRIAVNRLRKEWVPNRVRKLAVLNNCTIYELAAMAGELSATRVNAWFNAEKFPGPVLFHWEMLEVFLHWKRYDATPRILLQHLIIADILCPSHPKSSNDSTAPKQD